MQITSEEIFTRKFFKYLYLKQIFSVRHSPVYTLLLIVFCFGLLCFFSSCSNTKNITYFQDLTDTSKIYTQNINTTYEVVLQPDDLIGINVNSNNPEATAIFNMQGSLAPIAPSLNSGVNANVASTNQPENAYLIDKQGAIDFPVLGHIKAAGLTVPQLKDSLKNKLNQYLQAPVVNVRLLNYKITVLGEVQRPASYTITSERVTVLDAVGMAGDLTLYGKRENILLVREENGQRKFIRLNLNSSNLFESPYYYLKQNDVIYVEPKKAKTDTLNAETLRTIGVGAAVLTAVVLAFYRL